MPARAVTLLILALALAGCGRRGPLEAPGAAAPVAAPAARVAGGPAVEGQANPPGRAGIDDADAETEALVGSPIPTPPRTNSRRRAYTVPDTPFILDPLL